MASTPSSGSGYETPNLSQRRLSERFRQQAELQQARRTEEVKAKTRQRVAEAEDVSRRNLFPGADLAANQEVESSGVNTPPSPRRTIRARHGAVEIPAFHEFNSLNDASSYNNSEHNSSTADANDQCMDMPQKFQQIIYLKIYLAERPESSMSFRTAASSPRSFQSETSLETVTRDDIAMDNPVNGNENNNSDINESMLADPQVQKLMDELHRVQENQRILESNLDEAKKEIIDLRNQLNEAEERVIRAPHDSTMMEACENLRLVLRQCRDHRNELQVQLDQAEEREKELRAQLRQARQNIEDNMDTIERLRDELNAARLERDQHAQTVAALQHQLNDFRQQRGVQADDADNITEDLNRATEDRERYAGYVVRLQEQLRERQQPTRNLNNNRALTRYKSPTTTARSTSRTIDTIDKRGGRLRRVRHTIKDR